ncbi:MAG: 50S ribosomal protein L13 [Endomicrobium sp.]|jgi:large subunit ribosomal protein L13|nr:50S ribosomal protein L13 [Endomicrobium sp.]
MILKTYIPKKVNRQWHIIDADSKILGRLAVKIVQILNGKNKVFYTKHIDCGDFVIVINVSKILLTGKKLKQKTYFTYSGFPGGCKLIPYSELMSKSPEKALFSAVKGMLQKNKLAHKQIKRLKLFKYGDCSKHMAQIHNINYKLERG